jgi:CubicO group peptidase (beta-lactamase class C family)
VSTAPDVLAFLCALADGGAPLLPAAAVEAMTADALTPQLRGKAEHVLGPDRSWGLMTAVEPGGRWGWDGGTGTSARVDPAHDLVAVLLTQRLMGGPHDRPDAFWSVLTECAGASA